VLREPFEWLRLNGPKTRRFCSGETKAARFQASLSSPFGRGTLHAQPSNGFRATQPPPITIINGSSLRVFKARSLTHNVIFLSQREDIQNLIR